MKWPHVLVIGLGGTGHRVLIRLKAALRAVDPERAARFHLLALDTDREALSVPDPTTGWPLSLEEGEELLILDQVPLEGLRRRLGQHPIIARRFPDLPRLTASTLRRGARQLRLLGALSLVWHFPRVQRAVHHRIWSIADRRTEAAPPELNVILVTSLAGGTGSGIFLDVAYLVRHELQGVGDLNQRATMILMAVGPGAFHDAIGPNMIPNCVASLLELNHWMQHGGFRMEYPGGIEVEVDQPPFDRVFYIDAVDEAGRTWPNLEALCDLLVEAILVLAASPLGVAGEGVIANLEVALGQRTHEGYGTFMGSVGVASIRLPVSVLIERLAAERAERDLRRWLEGISPSDLTEQEAARWIQGRPWGVDAIRVEILQDAEGHPLVVHLPIPHWLMALLDPDELAWEARRYLEEYRRIRIEGDFRSAVQAAARRWLEQAVQDLDGSIERLALSYGLPAAEGLLEALRTHGAVLQAQLEDAFQEWANRSAAARRREEMALQDLSFRVGFLQPLSWPLVRDLFHRLYMIPRLRRAFQAAEEAGWAQLHASAFEAARGAIVRFLAHLEERQAELRQLRDLIGQAVQLIQQRAAQLHETLQAEPRDLRVLDEAALADLSARGADMEAWHLTPTLGELRAWKAEGAESVARRWVERARPLFAFLEQWSVEERLQGAAGPGILERWLALRRFARPAWLLDGAIWPPSDLIRLELLGVADAAHTLFEGCGAQLVSTGDRHRVTLLVLAMGAPISALLRFHQLFEGYRRALQRCPLHVFPDLPLNAIPKEEGA